jgi:hypothetical protein
MELASINVQGHVSQLYPPGRNGVRWLYSKLPAHSVANLVKVTFVSTRPGILRSRRILNHAKPSITAGGMKNILKTLKNSIQKDLTMQMVNFLMLIYHSALDKGIASVNFIFVYYFNSIYA